MKEPSPAVWEGIRAQLTMEAPAESAELAAPEPAAVEPSAHVTFEWIGDRNVLGEWKGSAGTRGANNTSADAAIRYLAADGATELALIEWKYTEDYRGRELSVDRGNLRPQRYEEAWRHPDCPVRTNVLPYEDLFVEPFYQLLRQQLDRFAQNPAIDVDDLSRFFRHRNELRRHEHALRLVLVAHTYEHFEMRQGAVCR